MSSHSISASMIHQNERRFKIGHYNKYNTNLLNLVENKLEYKRNYFDSKYKYSKLPKCRLLHNCSNCKNR